ncbi:hypothetical protein BB560_004734 [Smittium megazygosporum]|uniref:glucan 1,4-alpha-glucosidase n=1 Tax=Smittium megazygosporum TaxID=133381 RepID=A0A2T9Z8E2_9FUNG|nr:hypothetical protein BB560_004734 [Smittium megazygosporum]
MALLCKRILLFILFFSFTLYFFCNYSYKSYSGAFPFSFKPNPNSRRWNSNGLAKPNPDSLSESTSIHFNNPRSSLLNPVNHNLDSLVSKPGSASESSVFKERKELDDWVAAQYDISLSLINDNISPTGAMKGSVCASRSKLNPDYYYHWIRDSALTMNMLIQNLNNSDPGLIERLLQIEDFIDFSYHISNWKSLPSGLGEPKFNMDGTPFLKEWGRPQNDGPALRSICLINYANYLISQVRIVDHLYCDSGCIINNDLDYIVDNWRESSFEIWEEVKGFNYYTVMVQLKALEMGQLLASILGDFESAKRYHSVLLEMKDSLDLFWDKQNQIIMSTIHWAGGMPYKLNNLDSQSFLALLHTWDDSTDFYTDNTFTRTLSTVFDLFKYFNREYKINSEGLPAIAMGRYPGDKYDGYDSKSYGNPWPLITMGVAELYYKLSYEFSTQDHLYLDRIMVKFLNLKFFDSHQINLNLKSSEEPIIVNRDTIEFWDIVKSLFYNGEEFLKRVKHHTASDGSISEQWNRVTGFNQGAPNLTWSYTAFCTMKVARDRIKQILFTQPSFILKIP